VVEVRLMRITIPASARLGSPVAWPPRAPYASWVMSKTRTEVLSESRKKGAVAGATSAGAVAAGVLVAPVIGVVAAVPAAYFAWKWWKHRAENGIKF